MSNAIELRDVTRKFGRVSAADSMNFHVPAGSITGLLGRNGAGKTTAMAMISGQDRPSSGSVEVLGGNPFENSEILRNITFVRDNQRYPDGYKLHHVLRIAPDFAPNWSTEVAEELVERLHIPSRVQITKFSRGQVSSVAIVLGLASRAAVTLLDEPYLGLDVTARATFHEMLLRDFAEHPRTVLLSTHLIEESERMLDRVVIVDRGRTVVECDAEEARKLAFTVSGVPDAVDGFSAGYRVLRSQGVGGLKSVTVSGTLDGSAGEKAERHNVRLAPVSLQDLVAAHGEAETTEQSMGAMS